MNFNRQTCCTRRDVCWSPSDQRPTYQNLFTNQEAVLTCPHHRACNGHAVQTSSIQTDRYKVYCMWCNNTWSATRLFLRHEQNIKINFAWPGNEPESLWPQNDLFTIRSSRQRLLRDIRTQNYIRTLTNMKKSWVLIKSVRIGYRPTR